MVLKALNFIHPKANAIADCLENQFRHHDSSDEIRERRVETRVPDLLETVDNKLP
jgi:hypothetical protein